MICIHELKQTLKAVSVLPLLTIVMTGSAGSAVLSHSPRPGALAIKPLASGGSTGQGMKSGTSPSIAALAGSGYEIAFQANTGALIIYGSVSRNTGLTMMAGTSPAIAAAPGGGFEVAFQSSAGQLVTYSSSSGAANTGMGMRGGTSPSIAALKGGGFETAFQANTGALIVIGAGGNLNTGLGILAGTSPAIAAASGGGFEAAFQANTGYLYRYSSSSGAANLGQAMKAGTSPGIAAGSTYEIAFQNTSGYGSLYPSQAGLGAILVGTSPAITTAPSGNFEAAYQNSVGSLSTCILTSGSSACNGTGQGMMGGLVRVSRHWRVVAMRSPFKRILESCTYTSPSIVLPGTTMRSSAG